MSLPFSHHSFLVYSISGVLPWVTFSSSYIQSRFYRSPEVLLGQPYGELEAPPFSHVSPFLPPLFCSLLCFRCPTLGHIVLLLHPEPILPFPGSSPRPSLRWVTPLSNSSPILPLRHALRFSVNFISDLLPWVICSSRTSRVDSTVRRKFSSAIPTVSSSFPFFPPRHALCFSVKTLFSVSSSGSYLLLLHPEPVLPFPESSPRPSPRWVSSHFSPFPPPRHALCLSVNSISGFLPWVIFPPSASRIDSIALLKLSVLLGHLCGE